MPYPPLELVYFCLPKIKNANMASLNQKLRQSPIGRSPLIKKLYWQVQGILRKVGVNAPVSPNDAGVVWYRKRSAWKLDRQSCPCDCQLSEYLQQANHHNQHVFHFGTGGHHIVGRENHQLAQPNQIMAITASHPEHTAYVKLVLQERGMDKHYKVLFGDIYTLDARNLPMFDVISLFHLCEFYLPDQAAFVHHDDRSLLDLFITKLNPDGKVIFYDRSNNWPEAQLLVEALAARQVIVPVETYKNLRIYRRTTVSDAAVTA
jgi:SAM-dependent methyltransferase